MTEALLQVDEEIMVVDTADTETTVVAAAEAAVGITVEDETRINSKLVHWPTGEESPRRTMPYL
jgi:hypothetical protein